SGNVSRFAFLCFCHALRGGSNHDRQGKIVAPCIATFGHQPHYPPNARTIRCSPRSFRNKFSNLFRQIFSTGPAVRAWSFPAETGERPMPTGTVIPHGTHPMEAKILCPRPGT